MNHRPELWACNRCGAAYIDIQRVRAVSDGNEPNGAPTFRRVASQQFDPTADPVVCGGAIRRIWRLTEWIRRDEFE